MAHLLRITLGSYEGSGPPIRGRSTVARTYRVGETITVDTDVEAERLLRAGVVDVPPEASGATRDFARAILTDAIGHLWAAHPLKKPLAAALASCTPPEAPAA